MQAIRSTRPGGHVGFVGVTHDVAIPGLEYFFSAVPGRIVACEQVLASDGPEPDQGGYSLWFTAPPFPQRLRLELGGSFTGTTLEWILGASAVRREFDARRSRVAVSVAISQGYRGASCSMRARRHLPRIGCWL